MRGQSGFFDIDERLKELSAKGDDLERLKEIVNFEAFRYRLEKALNRSDRAKGGRPPYDCVLMFKVLVLQALTICPTIRQSSRSTTGCRSCASSTGAGRHGAGRDDDLAVPRVAHLSR